MNNLLEKIKKNEFYKVWFKDALPYVTGAILLSLLQVVTFTTTGSPWGASGILAYWGAWLFELVGGTVRDWFYFATPGAKAVLDAGFLNHAPTWQNIGIVMGALFASLMASGFKFKKIKSYRQVIAAVLGGLLMGYGARIAFGCNIGALFSGISSLSLSGWVFAVAMFGGAIVGSKLLVKFFM